MLLEGFREDDDFDAPLGILEHDDAHPVALACFQRPEAGDDTTDRDLFGGGAGVAVSPVATRRRARIRAGLPAFATCRSFGKLVLRAVSPRIQLAGRLGAVLAKIAGIPIDRVAAHEQAERLLLVVELLDLGPGRNVGEWNDIRRTHPGVGAAKEVGLP